MDEATGLQIQEAIIEIPEIFQHFFKFRIEISEQLKEEMLTISKEVDTLNQEIDKYKVEIKDKVIEDFKNYMKGE